MTTSQILVIFLVVYVLRIYTMKKMTKKQAKGKIYHPWSYPLLLTTYSTVFLGSFAEYFFGIKNYSFETNLLGAIILFFGIFLTGWAIKSVDSSWSQHIELKAKHKLCTTGPYKYMRNPYYLGVFFELLGACLLFNGYYALIFFFVIHMPFVIYRAGLEEAVMKKHLKGYSAYQKKVKNFI